MSNGRYKPYPKYNSAGEDWIGDIPTGWKVLRGKFLFREVSERSECGEETLLSVSEYYGVKPRGEVVEEGEFLSRAESLEGYKKCQVDDLVMNIMLAWKRGLGVSKFDGIVSPAYSVFRFFEGIDPNYMHHLLRTDLYTGHFKTRSTGVIDSRLRLYPESFFDTAIVVPPRSEQTQIARFLDHETAKIDRLIEKQEALIRLLKEKRQAVISHAVTKGLNPHAPLKDSGIEWLGQVPAHWKEYPLKTLCRIKHGYAFDSVDFADSGDFILMTPGNFNQRGGFRHMNPPKFYIGKNFPEEFILKPQQLLVAMTEQGPGLLGCSLFVPEEGTYLHNQRLGLVRDIRPERLSDRYLFHLFNSSRYRAEVSISATGTKVQHTSPEKLLSIKVWIPEVLEQKTIADFVDEVIVKFDALEAKSEETIALLQERRISLISAAVTGKIDVRHWQPPSA